MPDAAARYPLHRPEIAVALVRGDHRIAALAAGDVRRVRARQTLAEMGDSLGTVYRVREGWFARTRTLPDGRKQIIMVFLAGDIFGTKALFLHAQADAIEALSPGVVEAMDYRRLWEAYRADSDVALRITWQAIEDERRLHNHVVGLGQGNADERMAHMLLDMRGRLVRARAIAEDAPGYPMPLTQGQIADFLGLSLVHVNRVLRRLREGGLATVARGRATLHDLAGLAEIAQPVLDGYEQSAPEHGGGLA